MTQTAVESPQPQVAIDRRRSERVAAYAPAVVKTLGVAGQYDARIMQVSDGGLQLSLGVRLSPGTLIEVVWNDTLLLGEIVYIAGENGAYTAGVKGQHTIFGMAELARALHRSDW